MKKFLKSNEIYFTTVTTVLLSLMAIIVTYNSNRIAKHQSRINYLENSPDFYLSRLYVTDSTGYANEVVIDVFKDNGIAKNISLDFKSYFKIELHKNLEKKIVYINLNGLFYAYYRTGNNNGKIRSIKGFNNNRDLSNFIRQLELKLKGKGFQYVFVDEITIAEITFTDFLNTNKKEYYDISFGEGVLLNKNDKKVDLFNSLKISSETISIYKKSEIDRCLNIVLKKVNNE